MDAEAPGAGGADPRDFAVSLLKEGRSPAEVWEALVAAGVEPIAAQALVSELLELRRQAEISAIPPIETLPNVATVLANEGNFGMGFLAGLLLPGLSCFAVLILPSWNVGRETKNGIYAGCVASIAFIALLRILMSSR